MCVMKWLAFILECDNMLCLLCAYCLAFFMSSCRISIWLVDLCILAHLVHSCVIAYLSMSPSTSPKYWFQVGSHPFLIYEIPRLAFRSFACWHVCCPQFNSMDLPKSKRTSVPHGHILSLCACLFICFLLLLVCFICMFLLSFFICFFDCLLASLFVCCIVGWSMRTASMMQAKRYRLVG